MSNIDIISKLSMYYGFDIKEACVLLDIVPCKNVKVKDDANSVNNNLEDKIKPFDGIVKENCCKAVIYNHGLYTQCTNLTTKEFCSSICKNQKYGHIDHRKKFPVGTYVLNNGKQEISYQKVKKRLNKKNTFEINQERILTQDSDEEETTVTNVKYSKNPRGRPKVINKEIEIRSDSKEENKKCETESDDNIEEVCVRRQNIDGKEYLVSEDNVVFDNKTYKMLGRLVLGKIENLNKI